MKKSDQEMLNKLKDRYKKQNEYNKLNYDRFSFTVPAGNKERIKEAATKSGKTVNQFICDLVMSAADQALSDSGKEFPFE